MISAPDLAPAKQAKVPLSAMRWETGVLLLLAAVLLFLKANYIFSLPYNSDEPQHLHVAWGWAQGMVQYKDVFDNHTPIFHLLMAPFVTWIGERADILVFMRFVMVPLLLATLGCAYLLGSRLYSRRAGIWAALLGAACPYLLVTATEFRADDLWMLAWVATITVALGGPFTRTRAAASGLLLGFTFGVSMKTMLLLTAVFGSWGIIFLCSPSSRRKELFKGSPQKLLAALGGFLVVSLAIISFFSARGALEKMYYCVFEHNTLPGHIGGKMVWPVIFFVIGLWILVTLARKWLRGGDDPGLAVRRLMVALPALLFLLMLHCFWPIVTRQDYLPVVPLLAISLAALLLKLEASLFAGGRPGFLPVALATTLFIGFSVCVYQPGKFLWQKDEAVDDILRLTKPSDYVMDGKGESVFRRRPFYYALETLTEKRIKRGLIQETIAEEMVAKGTCVVSFYRLPEKTLAWVLKYYLPVTSHYLVTGCKLPPVLESNELQPRQFEVAIATRYAVVSADGPVSGTMDGIPCKGLVFLAAGTHTFISDDPRPLAVYWAQAAENGFKPLCFKQKVP